MLLVLWDRVHRVLIDRIVKQQDFIPTVIELLDDRAFLELILVLSGDPVDIVLPRLHPTDVVIKAGELVDTGRAEEPEELGDLPLVRWVIHKPELQVLPELFVELDVPALRLLPGFFLIILVIVFIVVILIQILLREFLQLL
jgi:hypothetical protein